MVSKKDQEDISKEPKSDELILKENGRVAAKRPKSEDGRPKSDVFLTTKPQGFKTA
jgi:hypothetical protein